MQYKYITDFSNNHHQFIKNTMSDARAYIIRTSQMKHTNRELY